MYQAGSDATTDSGPGPACAHGALVRHTYEVLLEGGPGGGCFAACGAKGTGIGRAMVASGPLPAYGARVEELVAWVQSRLSSDGGLLLKEVRAMAHETLHRDLSGPGSARLWPPEWRCVCCCIFAGKLGV